MGKHSFMCMLRRLFYCFRKILSNLKNKHWSYRERDISWYCHDNLGLKEVWPTCLSSQCSMNHVYYLLIVLFICVFIYLITNLFKYLCIWSHIIKTKLASPGRCGCGMWMTRVRSIVRWSSPAHSRVAAWCPRHAHTATMGAGWWPRARTDPCTSGTTTDPLLVAKALFIKYSLLNNTGFTSSCFKVVSFKIVLKWHQIKGSLLALCSYPSWSF